MSIVIFSTLLLCAVWVGGKVAETVEDTGRLAPCRYNVTRLWKDKGALKS